jgi:hypothetical protein
MIRVWMMVAMMLLSACGSSSPSTGVAAGTSTAVVTGSVLAGAVNGTVTVSPGFGQPSSANISGGNFRIALPLTWLASPLTFTVNGSYRDEVSGQTVVLAQNTPLQLHTTANSLAAAGGHVAITPDSTIIALLVKQGMTDAYANQLFQSQFGYAPVLNARPFDPYVTTPTQAVGLMAADPYAATASFHLGVWSQLAADWGLSNAADLAMVPQKIADDLGDGVWDGRAGAADVVFLSSGINLRVLHASIPLPSRLPLAVSRFAASPANVAALAPPQSGLPPLSGDASGARRLLALADGTQVQVQLDVLYSAPFPAGFATGRTRHQLTLTNMSTNGAIDLGVTGTLLGSPVVSAVTMYQYNGDQYTAPFVAWAGNVQQAAQGLYTFDVYYPASDQGVGQWQLQVDFTDHSLFGQTSTVSAMFYPHVTKAATMVAMSNPADQWLDGRGAMAPRQYYIALQDMKQRNPVIGYDMTVYAFAVDLPLGGSPVQGQYVPVLAGASVYGSLNGAANNTYSMGSVVLNMQTNLGPKLMSPVAASAGQYVANQVLGYVTGISQAVNFQLTVNGLTMSSVNSPYPTMMINFP